ncbi:hypothetical protein QBC38DRAFT_478630 [Podospora fimiseda]|uniref:AA1-like domain-containing protein n=1 Tax=Podospora fimiseda TaxID=252190 RepID=A0AAN7BPH4_9PEZI|nr:hypothetical protein QBC38DRAFT_478630 [Podospora fimiseda]
MVSTRFLLFTLSTTTASVAIPLAARQYDDYQPTCWDKILDLQWTISGLSYSASYTTVSPEANTTSWDYVGFTLSNSAVGYMADCVAGSVVGFNGTEEYSCTLGEGAPEGAGVKFKFAKEQGKVEVEEVILCSEGEGHSATFVAKGETGVSLGQCTDETQENEEWKEGEVYKNREVKCAGGEDVSLWPSQFLVKE